MSKECIHFLGHSVCKRAGTSHEDVSTFMKISRRILLRMRDVADRSCRENPKTHLAFDNVSPKIVSICEIMWK